MGSWVVQQTQQYGYADYGTSSYPLTEISVLTSGLAMDRLSIEIDGSNRHLYNWQAFVSDRTYRFRVYVDSASNYTIYSSSKLITSASGNWVTPITGKTVSGSTDITAYMEYYQEVYPGIPSSITVPSEVKEGEQFTISWGTATNATRYYLERSINGGAYANLTYTTGALSYVDTALSTWDTVSYRVRGYTVDGYSDYRTSSAITVKHFPELKFNIDGVLKTSEMGWVNIDGVLKEIKDIRVNVDGTLKEV